MFRIAARSGASHARRALGRRAFGSKAQPPSTARNIVWAAGTLTLGGLGYLYVTDASAGVHKYVTTPLMRLLDAETAHDLAVFSLKHGLHPVDRKNDDALLEVTLWGKRVSNPIGLAAGFDKNAEAVDALFDLGFGSVEVGSVTPSAQAGNPKPRLFRVDETGTTINRMGLNNDGVDVCGDRLRSRFWRLVAAQSQQKGETVAALA
ncbi:dihydroorotate dehydrogenase, partial [Coemansia sp. RSA 2703]